MLLCARAKTPFAHTNCPPQSLIQHCRSQFTSASGCDRQGLVLAAIFGLGSWAWTHLTAQQAGLAIAAHILAPGPVVLFPIPLPSFPSHFTPPRYPQTRTPSFASPCPFFFTTTIRPPWCALTPRLNYLLFSTRLSAESPFGFMLFGCQCDPHHPSSTDWFAATLRNPTDRLSSFLYPPQPLAFPEISPSKQMRSLRRRLLSPFVSDLHL